MFGYLSRLLFSATTPERIVKGRFDLHILIYKEENLYVAHCLELDIVGSGTTQENALKEMRELVVAQITFHFEHKIEDKLFHPAPAEYWNKWLRAVPYPCQEKSLHEKVESLKCATIEEDNLVIA